ncbi:MAG: cobalt transporter CbiM [Bacillota bacterium]
MHIPDGYLSPSTSLVLAGAMVPVWRQASKKVAARFDAGRVPLVAIGAAFAFVVMMLNVPVPDGTTAHAVGGTLLAIVLGPWAASLALSVATLLQALFFADGGVLAFGANAFNMAFLLPFAGYGVYRLVRGRASAGSWRYYAAAATGAYVGINLAGLATGFELGIQPMLFHTAAGAPLYSPYGLKVALAAMGFAHVLIAGPVEAVVSVLALGYLYRTQPALLIEGAPAGSTPAAGSPPAVTAGAQGAVAARPAYLRLLMPLAVLILITPLGLLARGKAWGEWDLAELQARLGYVPEGLARFTARWPSLFPGYSLPSVGGGHGAVVGYLFSGLFGLAAIAAVAVVAALVIRRRAHAGPR